jgi:hypothetical protein
MAQLALTAVGFVVGNAILPGLGGQIGAAVGGAVGASLTAPDLQGPRLENKRLELGSYGTPIVHTWGSDRVTGVPMWTTGLTETESSQGGKGGPSVTTYSYSASFAVALNTNRVKAIRRLWLSNKLVYDAREGSTAEVQAESQRWRSYWVLYKGDAAQLPDPTMEAIDGVGNVPAYRGTAYLVFTDLPLAEFGNSRPVVEAEIETERDEAEIDPASDVEREPLRVWPWKLDSSKRPVHSLNATLYSGEDYPVGTSTSFSDIATAQAAAASADGGYSGSLGVNSFKSVNFIGLWRTSANPLLNEEPNGARLEDDPQYVYVPAGYTQPERPPMRVSKDPFVLRLGTSIYGFIVDDQVGMVTDALVLRAENGALDYPASLDGFAPTPFAQILLSAIPYLLSTAWISYCYNVRSERVPTHPLKSCVPGNACKTYNGRAELPTDPDWCVSCDGQVTPNRDWVIVEGSTAKQLCAVEYRNGVLYQNALGPVLLPADPNYSDTAYWEAQATAAISAGLMRPDVTFPVVVTTYAESTGGPTRAWEVGNPATTTLTLADVVQDICLATGKLTAGQVDVTELTDTVIGYTRSRRMAARAALEPLMRAYFFAAVESDGKVAFRKIERASTATLTVDDLGVAEGQAEPELLKKQRGQEEELPISVVVAYKSVELDYQPNTQMARRRVGETTQQATAELAVVLTDDHAAQIAQAWLYLEWVRRNTYTLSTWRKHASVEPTDIIEVDDGLA